MGKLRLYIEVQWNVGVAVKRTMYQRKVDVDMLNAVKIWNISPCEN